MIADIDRGIAIGAFVATVVWIGIFWPVLHRMEGQIIARDLIIGAQRGRQLRTEADQSSDILGIG